MDKNFRTMFTKVAFLVGALVAVSLCIWYYSIPTESDVLVLDKSVLTVILDETWKRQKRNRAARGHHAAGDYGERGAGD